MKLTQIIRARGQFQYFKRYVEREMQKSYLSRKWHPLTGLIERKRLNWYYGEHRPWTTEFMDENKEKRFPVLVEPLKEWNVFKGDRVQILVGKDEGKQGLINTIIEERNWVYVEGLNCEYNIKSHHDSFPPLCLKEEKPLLVSQIQLVDPSDDSPTEIEWRFTKEGERVRVSTKSGRVIPLPPGADMYDDLVIPKHYVENRKKDTSEKILKKVTFKPKLCSFDEDVMKSMGIVEDKKPAPTYWY